MAALDSSHGFDKLASVLHAASCIIASICIRSMTERSSPWITVTRCTLCVCVVCVGCIVIAVYQLTAVTVQFVTACMSVCSCIIVTSALHSHSFTHSITKRFSVSLFSQIHLYFHRGGNVIVMFCWFV